MQGTEEERSAALLGFEVALRKIDRNDRSLKGIVHPVEKFIMFASFPGRRVDFVLHIVFIETG